MQPIKWEMSKVLIAIPMSCRERNNVARTALCRQMIMDQRIWLATCIYLEHLVQKRRSTAFDEKMSVPSHRRTLLQ